MAANQDIVDDSQAAELFAAIEKYVPPIWYPHVLAALAAAVERLRGPESAVDGF